MTALTLGRLSRPFRPFSKDREGKGGRRLPGTVGCVGAFTSHKRWGSLGNLGWCPVCFGRFLFPRFAVSSLVVPFWPCACSSLCPAFRFAVSANTSFRTVLVCVPFRRFEKYVFHFDVSKSMHSVSRATLRHGRWTPAPWPRPPHDCAML